jgi:hypothetical protein
MNIKYLDPLPRLHCIIKERGELKFCGLLKYNLYHYLQADKFVHAISRL